jgi:hypothetical protein
MKKLLIPVTAGLMILIAALALPIHGQEKEEKKAGPLFRVKYNDRWGFIDAKGEIVIKPQFEEVTDFSPEGVAVVRVASNYTLIDRTGKRLRKPVFDSIWNIGRRPANLRVSNRWGYIDKSGKVVIDMPLSFAPHFSSGLIPVEVNGKWGYADAKGEIVVKPEFYRAWPFRNGLGEVWVSPNPNTTVGYIDKAGKYVWAPKR